MKGCATLFRDLRFGELRRIVRRMQSWEGGGPRPVSASKYYWDMKTADLEGSEPLCYEALKKQNCQDCDHF